MAKFDLKADSITRDGFLFKEAIPLFTCEGFADWWLSASRNFPRDGYPEATRGAEHSFPKDPGSRRKLTFPNPANFVKLASAMEIHWDEIQKSCDQSRHSLSRLSSPAPKGRSVTYFRTPKDQAQERVQLRAGYRYYVHTDISRFFQSVYLHRFELLFPGTIVGTRSNGLGSKLDNLSRCVQRKESIGIPLGPDTSFVLAELLGSFIDQHFPSGVGAIRHVDDITIYGESYAAVDRALAKVRHACSLVNLELNSQKTRWGEIPEELESEWISLLRPLANALRSVDALITLFDRALSLFVRTRDSRVLGYAITSASKMMFYDNAWPVLEAFLYTCLLTDSKSILNVRLTLQKAVSNGFSLRKSKALKAIQLFIRQHAELNHGYEVVQALWLLHETDLLEKLTSQTWARVTAMQDNFVAITTLWLRDNHNLPTLSCDYWKRLAADSNCYNNENWLLGHETRINGWFKLPRPPLCTFWNLAVENNVSFIDPLGGVRIDEINGDDVSSHNEAEAILEQVPSGTV
jgi:hypothetical protein